MSCWGLWPGRQHFRSLWETIPKTWGWKSVCVWCWQRGACSQSHLRTKLLRSQRAGIIVNVFSASLSVEDARSQVHENFSPENIWRPVLAVPSFFILILTLLSGGCWRSAATRAQGLNSYRTQWQVAFLNWHLKF